jgi:hypothetical protein
MRAFLFAATVAAALVIGFGIGLAADPPAAADKSLWQAIKDDPRAVAALVGAFAGFSGWIGSAASKPGATSPPSSTRRSAGS